MECLFGSEGGQTVVYPIDWPEEGFNFPENESERCSEAHCHKKEVAYAPSKIQIQSVMGLSSNCTQKVSHTCNFNALTGVSSWIGSNSTANSYWHGNRNSVKFKFFAFDTRVPSYAVWVIPRYIIFIGFDYHTIKLIKDNIGCQCALSDTCKTFEKPTFCNCDSRGFNVTDVGVLSSDQLPIYGLYYGGSHTPYSFINYNVGPLICSGKNGFYPSEADDIAKETFNSRLDELKNEIKETKENLSEISDHLDDYLRTTTSTTTTTTTTDRDAQTVISLLSCSGLNFLRLPPVVIWYDGHVFVNTSWYLLRISGSANPNEIKFPGPISIARNNFVSKLDYSNNFEVSFEYKASVVPTSGWHHIISGSLIIIDRLVINIH